jgi:hypothetical protein
MPDEQTSCPLSEVNGPTVAEPGKPKPSGSRQAGKRRTAAITLTEDSDEDSDEDLVPTKRGRPVGSPNFRDSDIKKLLEIVERVLPPGPREWHEVFLRYNTWASKNQRPSRPLKALETKFKTVRSLIWDVFTEADNYLIACQDHEADWQRLLPAVC